MNVQLHIPPSGYYTILKKDGDVIDVADYMVNLIRTLQNDIWVQTEAEVIMMNGGRDVLNQLANMAWERVYFEPDNHIQRIRTPRRLIMDERGNCVDYTVYIGSVAHALGLPVTVRIVQLPGQNNFGHVYPVVGGIPVDVVPGQEQTGREYLVRDWSKKPVVGAELPYLMKQDFIV